MGNTNTSQLLLALDQQRQNLAANLSQKGVAASNTEGLSALVPKVLNIAGGGGGTDLDTSIIISSRQTIKNQYAVFTDWETHMPDLDKIAALFFENNDSIFFATKENIQSRTTYTSGVFSGISIPVVGYYWESRYSKFTEITNSQIILDKTYGVYIITNGSRNSPAVQSLSILLKEKE